MKILLSPQRNNKKIEYKFEGEKVIATLDGITDVFDFSNMPEGVMQEVKTKLSLNPIFSAKRENGELYIELLNLIGENATEEEKFPEWRNI